ncbi:MAG: hypothetical protein EA402_02655 [Planctomycetota bacterium]|nr:MAG: hypothetical protein EA402_02655 [Planctomycetota bacterium]
MALTNCRLVFFQVMVAVIFLRALMFPSQSREFFREDIELNRLDVSILREIIESIEKESVDTEGSNSVDDMPTLNETSEVDTLPPEDHSEP